MQTGLGGMQAILWSTKMDRTARPLPRLAFLLDQRGRARQAGDRLDDLARRADEELLRRSFVLPLLADACSDTVDGASCM